MDCQPDLLQFCIEQGEFQSGWNGGGGGRQLGCWHLDGLWSW
jgi:hypothetical protein